jgi:PAS domain S-box-containing protein
VDYISKPFNNQEILARVKTHLGIQKLIREQLHLNQKLQDQNEELVESKNQHRIMIESSAEGVFKLDKEMKITECNSKFFSKLGFQREDLLGKPIGELINSEDPQKAIAEVATKRFGERATKNIRIQFCVNENSSLWEERKYYSMLVDSYGIWNLSNDIVHEKNVEKKHLGTICIVKLLPEKTPPPF